MKQTVALFDLSLQSLVKQVWLASVELTLSTVFVLD